MGNKDTRSILLIDDDVEVLDMLGKMIERGGWKCFRAPSGEIGIDVFKANKIDAVVLDINLPNKDGYEVLRQMKELKPDVRVIMLTGLGYEKKTVEKALSLGASGYVGKAMPVKTIISKIKDALGK
ncbi:MAG: response regulator [Candidatus Omnitrophica bacterium]|nr:response regulator [Candidatus Omnitrophota bacterium]